MPSSFEKGLTDEQRSRLRDWWNAKLAPPPSCPLCRATDWRAVDEIVELRPYAGGKLVVGGGLYPNIAIICQNCGYTALINALAAGVVKPDEARGGKDAT